MRLVDVYSEGCPPCIAMEPHLERLSGELGVEVERIDAMESGGFIDFWNILGVPTLLVLDKDGSELHRIIGYRSYEDLKEELEGVF